MKSVIDKVTGLAKLDIHCYLECCDRTQAKSVRKAVAEAFGRDLRSKRYVTVDVTRIPEARLPKAVRAFVIPIQ
jgi:hypothetical protein